MNRHADVEYRRYTTVLSEDARDYAISPSRRPRGKAVVEIKGQRGMLKCSVKNLALPRDRETGGGYHVWLVSEEGDRQFPVYAGSITVNEQGVGESTWSFNTAGMKQTGLDMEALLSLEIRTGSSGEFRGDRVLAGMLELEEINLPEEPRMEKVTPFGGGLPYYQWWKFYPVLPDNPEKTGNYRPGPVFQGHQLIGLQYDHKGAVKYLVHGIPGRFCLRDQPFGGATGYIYWHPLPGQRYKAGDYGYWLVHIDPQTGRVVFPRRATKPPDCSNCNRDE